MDKLSPAHRSRVMAAVRGKNTTPELKVRKMLHALGFRYRLYRKDLPGQPDIIFPKYRVCIFVHGCFWHQHPGCKRSSRPSSNEEFWTGKLDKNVARDDRNRRALRKLGWRVAVIWECETKDPEHLSKRIAKIFPEVVGLNKTP